MLAFPQLSSGAVSQFPFRRETRFRTLVNSAADSSVIKAGDVDFQSCRWELASHHLSDAEWQAIEDLHVQTEGRLLTFLFLEPGNNLLSWSETLADPVWTKDAAITVTDGQADPMGGTRGGTVSNSGSPGALSQALNAPASYRYAGNVWVRTASTGASLEVSDGAAQVASAPFDSTNQWKQYSAKYNLLSGLETVSFRIVVPSGGTVDIYGPQLEAQPAPSQYKKTAQQAGVYSNARFADDVLTDRATGLNRHSGVIRIVWTQSPI